MANQNNNERSIIFDVPFTNLLNRSPSLTWKIFHGTQFMLGGLGLICGSSMYFIEIVKHYPISLTAGGWLLSIGSFFLLLSDVQEWWYNRINHSQQSYSSIKDRLKRRNIEINSFLSACGSALYVVGSILLIPTFEKHVIIGNWLIIIGSTSIFLSSIWKICRNGQINVTNPYDHQFRLENLQNDLCNLMIDVLVAFGSLFYFFGVIILLVVVDKNNFHMNLSASLCVSGGISFFIASLFLQYRYYSKE